MNETEETSPFDAAAREVSNGADPQEAAARLVALLSEDELLGMLDGDVAFWPGLADMTAGGYHSHPWPAARVERLGIPGLQFSDGPRGVVIGSATCFPVSMARGATFDPDLEEAIGVAIGQELRASGATYYGGVCVNLLRHPGWGRAQETYGEDPLHVGEFGAALTRGVQRHAMACVKHFALNSLEDARFTVDVTADERALHEVYLPHFRRVIDEGVASVMSAYNSVNGTWAGQNHALLTEVLRDEWGFEGFVTSDFIFGLRDAVESVRAGLDIEMPFRQQRAVDLPAALADGTLTRADIEAPAIRVIATFLRFAEVLSSPPPPASILGCAGHRALARRAATESMVLLRNAGDLLPLESSSLGRVVVIGELAAVPNLGDGGSSDVSARHVVTPLDGLTAALPDAEVIHTNDPAQGAGADLAVVVVGYTKVDEGECLSSAATDVLLALFPSLDHPVLGSEATRPVFADPHEPFVGDLKMADGGDRRSLRLHASDEALIAGAVEANPNTVVAVMSGAAVVMPWADRVPAVVQLWYPGQEGGHALADILLGHEPPSGRLPFAIPRNDTDLVDFEPESAAVTYGLLHGQWHLDAEHTDAHFPFGYGLSTTTFELVEAHRSADNEVTVTVRNTGERDGVHVVQIYASVPDSRYLRPARRLVGFSRLPLAAGHESDAVIAIDLSQLHIRENGKMSEEEGVSPTLTAASHAADPGIACL